MQVAALQHAALARSADALVVNVNPPLVRDGAPGQLASRATGAQESSEGRSAASGQVMSLLPSKWQCCTMGASQAI